MGDKSNYKHYENISIRPQMDTLTFEAESVAYVVSQHYGIETSEYSFPYVAGWSTDKEVPELKASLDTIRRAASDLIVKIDEKIAELTQGKEKNEFAEIDQWLAAHADELPFDNPGAGKPIGYIEVSPPVDLSSLGKSKEITLTAAKEPEGEKDTKRKSVKEQISEKKEKVAKTPKAKKVDTKNLGEAI